MRTGSDADGGSFEPIVEPHGYRRPMRRHSSRAAARLPLDQRPRSRSSGGGRTYMHCYTLRTRGPRCTQPGGGTCDGAARRQPDYTFQCTRAIVEDDEPTPYMRPRRRMRRRSVRTAYSCASQFVRSSSKAASSGAGAGRAATTHGRPASPAASGGCRDRPARRAPVWRSSNPLYPEAPRTRPLSSPGEARGSRLSHCTSDCRNVQRYRESKI